MVGALAARTRALSPEAAQRLASDPHASVWVAASAGTGKTKVLTDRVLRLMLGEGDAPPAPPQRILCLTFTKAAAAEMANRLYRSLGRWAIESDRDLAEDLEKLTGAGPDADTLARARRLFARVLDAPGGMRIQTIHSFCQALLARFPLEAGIPPHFEVIDERTAGELMAEVQEGLAAAVEPGGGDALGRAFAAIAGHVHELTFPALLAELAGARGRIERLVRRHGGSDGLIAALARRLELAPGASGESVIAAACAEGAFDRAGLTAACRTLAAGQKSDREAAALIAPWLDAADAEARVRLFAGYRRAFLTGTGKLRARLCTKAVADADAGAAAALAAEAERIDRAAERGRRAAVLGATAALITLGTALLDGYQAHKRAHGWLDYDDLILGARSLLGAGGRTAWVLYKLDGGLDHILIDEAQDTNPDQWQVVAALAEEFFAGEGARELRRTVFAVGDAKQSIFSFQGADPRAFAEFRSHFARRVRDAERDWREVGLDVSFRSTAAVLDAVDATFADPAARDGLDDGGDIRHRSARAGQAGLVELWPPLAPEPADAPEAWKPPVERRPPDSPRARLAELVAAKIARLCDGERLESSARAIEPGDVMVLVRRRNSFMDELIRRLKERAIPVAGIDRLVLTDHIAVMDLVSLGRFLLLPDDDLSLAEVLKSPLCGLDDDDLFDLAHGRGEASLWQRLRARGGFATAMLEALLARVDLASPFELYARVLGADRGRERILSRLGADASDPLDEFLAQALAYERGHVPSLQGFLHWLETGRTEIKRDLDVGRGDSVRVMTVHGAKGLQAPVVFLPDTLQVPRHRAQLAWAPDGDAVLWAPASDVRDSLSAAWREQAAARGLAEYRRLLYVAMTRAADRLYVCGWETKRSPPEDCWYRLVQAGLAAGATAETVADAALGFTVVRLRTDQTAPPEPEPPARAAPRMAPLPDWIRAAPPAEPVPPRPLVPSAPVEAEPPARSPRAAEDRAAATRGRLIHRLLQHLPELAPAARAAACRRFLARPSLALADAEQEAIARSVLAVLDDPAYAAAFAPASRAEVAIAGALPGAGGRVLAGQVDRIAVSAAEVLVVDYKTGRAPPARPEDVPGAYLRQMAGYRAGLCAIYPDRPVRCALLWTEGPRLMALDDALLDAHAP
ncbi:MAG TPA: double-strand break repair helicase AddA [Alphaproteobacteria bacterium]